ncbi:MAG: D-2-hydroxyacid dehydrogenase [Candidatus Puniceispirillaceae bacterium]
MTQRLNIIHLDRATIGPAIHLGKPACDHDWTSYDKTAADQVIDRLKDADIAVLNKVALSAHDIEQLPRLKMIAISATGFDKIDIAACQSRNIIVSNIRGYARHSVPEHSFALILGLRRALKGYGNDVANGMWQDSQQFCFFTHPISDLKGSVLGLIGTGTIGGEVARIAEAFGMTVIKAARKDATDVPEGYLPFDTVLAQADILSLHCPLTPQTTNLIAASEFAKMAKKPLLINTSRGGLVNENDLIAALDAGQISGAGFDVVTTEPPAPDHIFMQNLHRPNFILTPHTAWASDEAMQILWDQLISHIDAFAAGSPTNNVAI